MDTNIFQKIIDKELEAKIVHEDDLCIAFHDVNPQAPVHILVIPKKPIKKISDVEETDKELLGYLLMQATKIAKESVEDNQYRIVINNGELAGQSVFHLHLHILGGRLFSWPPG